MRRSPDHVDASIPRGDLRVSDISLRLAGLWPDQSGGCSQARGIWVFADPRMKAGKIMTYKAVRAGKEVSLVIDSFGKVKELP
jgi:hypothetical protein